MGRTSFQVVKKALYILIINLGNALLVDLNYYE